MTNIKAFSEKIAHIVRPFGQGDDDIFLNAFKLCFLKYIIDNRLAEADEFKIKRLLEEFSIAQLFAFLGEEYINASFLNAFDDKTKSITGDAADLICELLLSRVQYKNDPYQLCYTLEYIFSSKEKKNKGTVYTAKNTIDAIFALVKENITKTTRLLDPACGSGCFLLAAYDIFDHLHSDITDDFERHKHILDNNLFGCDVNATSVAAAKMILSLKHKKPYISHNILCADILIEKIYEPRSFDLLIGNPPYIGHKQLDKEYMKVLRFHYTAVFRNKSDISYCFVYLAHALLKPQGKMAYIMSRYFMEAEGSTSLRKFLLTQFSIDHIIDFYGIRIIKNVGIDAAILCATNEKPKPGHTITIRRAHTKECKKVKVNKVCDLLYTDKEAAYFNIFELPQAHLTPAGFRIVDDKTRLLIKKIEDQCLIALSDLFAAHQGIITGLDKAFVFDRNSELLPFFDASHLKPWIKSSNIQQYHIKDFDYILLYTNDLDDAEIEEDMPELAYLSRFKPKLAQRRECLSGKLPWYHLQWGRSKAVFESKKIVFPYKASSNRFALDTAEHYFSADVYALTFKRHAVNISYEFIVILLNSDLYDFYYKTFAKKLGENMYEYYPNMLMKLKIPMLDVDQKMIKEAYRQLLARQEGAEREENLKQLNDFVYRLFHITEEERAIVEGK